jgi:predicted RND superfamily exporter protein
MEQLDTEELQGVYRAHDPTQYVPDAFEVVAEILRQRGVDVPEPGMDDTRESTSATTPPPGTSAPTNSAGGYLGFRKMISTELIKAVYLLGALAVLGLGVLLFVRGEPALGVLVALGGNVVWRLICEAGILLFSIHDLLASIERKIT